MNHKNVIILVAFIVITSCGHKISSSAKNTDEEKGKSDSLCQSFGKISNKLNLLGVWKIKGDDNPVFVISKDSIYYIDQGISYRYQVIEDSIHIYYTEWNYSGQLSLTNDELKIKDINGENTYTH